MWLLCTEHDFGPGWSPSLLVACQHYDEHTEVEPYAFLDVAGPLVSRYHTHEAHHGLNDCAMSIHRNQSMFEIIQILLNSGIVDRFTEHQALDTLIPRTALLRTSKDYQFFPKPFPRVPRCQMSSQPSTMQLRPPPTSYPAPRHAAKRGQKGANIGSRESGGPRLAIQSPRWREWRC